MKAQIRHSVIAGSWYPGDPSELRQTIDGYMRNVSDEEISGVVVGLISPHAGYIYSGQTAAYGYKQLQGQSFDAVVIISPMHRMAYDPYLINDSDYYETPLGNVPVDQELVQSLCQDVNAKLIKQDAEHSLEIQLPFLQSTLREFELLPIMVSHSDVFGCEDIVSSLTELLKDRKSLLIASSDLHHIENYEEVVRKDDEIVRALTSFDLEKIRKRLATPDCSVCGRVPISIVLETTRRLGANQLLVLQQTNSGDVTGRKHLGEYTVGYVSAAITCTMQTKLPK